MRERDKFRDEDEVFFGIFFDIVIAINRDLFGMDSWKGSVGREVKGVEEEAGEEGGGGDDDVVEPPAAHAVDEEGGEEAAETAAEPRADADEADGGTHDDHVVLDEAGDHEGAEDGGDEEAEALERVVEDAEEQGSREERVREGVKVEGRRHQEEGRAGEASLLGEAAGADPVGGEGGHEGAGLPGDAVEGGLLLARVVHCDAPQHDVVGAALSRVDGRHRPKAQQPETSPADQSLDCRSILSRKVLRASSR